MIERKATVRYSDSELAEFKAIIDAKLSKAKEQLEKLQEQILETTENNSDEHGVDWVDDSSTNNNIEMLNNMAIRQRKFIKDLENALIRIRNKTYGVCVLSGELIDKRRLKAVPTTTKSLVAKSEEQRIKISKSRSRTRLGKNPYISTDANSKYFSKRKNKPASSSSSKRKSKVVDDDESLINEIDAINKDILEQAEKDLPFLDKEEGTTDKD